MERKYFNSSYGKISYIERDGKDPIIFLHGLGGTGNSWTKLSPYLNEKIGLYLIDLLGHGHSDKPNIDYTIEVQEKAIQEFIISNNIENYTLMGNSYGGWISLRFAVDVREPKKLILEDSAGINITYGEVSDETRNEFINRIVKSNDYNSRHVIESIIKNNANPKWKMKEEELAKIKTDTLILWGTDDRTIDLKYGEKLSEFIPNNKFVKIDNGGHTPHIRKPKDVAYAINSFIT
jgi:pimeloyl-ACP methyl ester carboxylesterase